MVILRGFVISNTILSLTLLQNSGLPRTQRIAVYCALLQQNTTHPVFLMNSISPVSEACKSQVKEPASGKDLIVFWCKKGMTGIVWGLGLELTLSFKTEPAPMMMVLITPRYAPAPSHLLQGSYSQFLQEDSFKQKQCCYVRFRAIKC